MSQVRKSLDDLDIPFDSESCVARQVASDGAYTESQHKPSKVGVVVVLCTEDMSVFEKVGCRGGRVRFYVYSKCGLSEREVAHGAPGIARCLVFQEAHATVYTDLTWSKAHSEYLEHLITRYDELEESLVFTKAKVSRAKIRHIINISAAVDDALTGVWAYKPLWPTKFSLRFDECPMACNARQFGRELCALYRRYTCEAGCYSCPWDNEWLEVEQLTREPRMQVSRCFFPNPRSTFIVAASRVRSLPVTEYMWLREWIQSWQEGSGGIFRRLMGERLWPALFGCPEDIHHNTSDGGCLHGMRFPAGKRRRPPREMIDDGLVHSPGGTEATRLADPRWHTSRHPYPHIPSPRLGARRLVTFGVLYPAAAPSSDALDLLRAAVASALQFHPSARLFVLVDRGQVEKLRSEIGHSMFWFAGRLEVHVADARPPEGGDRNEAAWLEVASHFLRSLVAAHGDPGSEFGHIILMPLGAIVLGALTEAFEDGFHMAVAAQPVPGRELSPRLMVFHRDRLRETVRALFPAAGPADRDGRSLASLLQGGRLLGCATGRDLLEAARAANATAVRCPSDDPEAAAVGLLPCRLWAAVHTLQGHEDADKAARKERSSCRTDLEGSKSVVLHPAEGAVAWQIVHKMREYAEPELGRAYLEQV